MDDFGIHCTMNLEIDFQGKVFYGDMLNLPGEKHLHEAIMILFTCYMGRGAFLMLKLLSQSAMNHFE